MTKCELWFDYEQGLWVTYFGDWEMDRVLFTFDNYDKAYLQAKAYNDYYQLR